MRLADHLVGRECRFPRPVFVALSAVLGVLTPAPRPTPFDGPMIVAERLLHGEPDLPPGLTWMEGFTEGGRRFLAYPPMVSFILVPYAAVGGGALGQTAANSLLVFSSALVLHSLLR